jgi:uncharacterized membrane protein
VTTGESSPRAPRRMAPRGRRGRIIAPALLVAAIIVSALATDGEAGLRYCNRTPVPLDTAVGMSESGRWVSSGWWYVLPEECVEVIAGPLRERYYYTYAENTATGWSWGGRSTFCARSAAFTGLPDGDCQGRGLRALEFSEVDTGDDTSRTVDFVCSTCQLPHFTVDPDRRRITVAHVLKESMANRLVYLPVEGSLVIEASPAAATISVRLTSDLRHLQRMMPDIVSGQANKDEECHDRVHTHGVRLTPDGPAARLAVSARYEKWHCTYADVPQVRCKDTWIRVGPVKTKGVPHCTTTVQTTRTSKTKLIQQTGHMRLALHAEVEGRASLGIRAEVVDVSLDGLGGFLASLFRVDLKGLAQRRIEDAIGGRSLLWALPEELRDVVSFREARFRDLGEDRLAAQVEGAVTVDLGVVRRLCRRFTQLSGCA